MRLIRFNKNFFRFLGPLLFIFILWKVGNISSLVDLILSANPLPLIITAILSCLILFLKVLRWTFLLKSQGHIYKLKKACIAVASSTFLGVVTPSRIGDLMRVQFIKQDLGVPYTKGLSVSIMDKLCDLYVLILFVVIGISYLEINHESINIILILNFSIIFFLFASVFFFFSTSTKGILKWILPSLIFKKWVNIQRKFVDSMRSQIKPAIFVAIPVTILVYLMGFFQGWLIAQSIEIDISFFEVISLISITSLLGLLPISISGFGIREFIFSIYFPTLGYTIEQGIVYGLLVSLFLYLLYALIGFISWQLFPFDIGKNANSKY